ncbi:thiol-disulfide oxidoreductase DCC family protein [Nereida sp. MMG025]|uniref:thiol-disulfide oxidoreductase DCC family protein n=1 Tax=Nereida sp. MMG025 TaxID=2909981 RepID=UPI001F1A6EC7|nr:DCC1-like thiol-disulfide oxidoreductase family protein [Nereida sp. MMG025]MCF6443968.1 DCC1-like thiol-disulfide oxidoreductase family protein [Nereida sp. MMG025]
MNDPFPIAYMDGQCSLCSFGARAIDWLDRSGQIRICPVQSERGRAALAAHGLDPEDPESWLFIADGQAWDGFDAVAQVGRRCGGLGHVVRVVMILPAPLRQWLYRRVARNRYRLFGRREMCQIPSASLQARLID